MPEALPQILRILVLFSVPLTGLCLGIETGQAYLSRLWRMPGVLIRFFIASFVIMPALAVVIRFSENLPPAVWVALFLISMTPPSPVSHKGSQAFSGYRDQPCLATDVSAAFDCHNSSNAADCGARTRIASEFGNRPCNLVCGSTKQETEPGNEFGCGAGRPRCGRFTSSSGRHVRSAAARGVRCAGNVSRTLQPGPGRLAPNS